MRLTVEAFDRILTVSYDRQPDDATDEPGEHDHNCGSFDPAPPSPAGEGERWYEERATIGFGRP